MAEFPALPLWTDAYMADTTDLSAEHHGVYLMMMMIAWRRPDCALPSDMGVLKRMLAGACCDMHGNRFNRIVPDILARFWTLGPDGKFHQPRLDKERGYLRDRSVKYSANARKRWQDANVPREDSGRNPDEKPTENLRKTSGKHSGKSVISTTETSGFNDLADATAYAGHMPPHPHPHPHLERKRKKEVNPTSVPEAGPHVALHQNGHAAPPSARAARAVEVWNEVCGSLLGVVRRLTPARAAALKARLAEEFHGSLDQWAEYCRRIVASPFLRGENDRGWRADFDYAVRQSGCIKILEGRFDGRPSASKPVARMNYLDATKAFLERLEEGVSDSEPFERH